MKQRPGFLLGFLSGLTYPIRGMRFVFRDHRELARYWVVPVILTLLAFVGLGWMIAKYHGTWVSMIWSPSPSLGATSHLVRMLLALLDWFIMIVVFALGGVLLVLSGNVVAAPFNDALSAAVERIQGTLPAGRNALKDIARDIVRSTVLELVKVLALVGLMTPLLVANLFAPAIGAPLLVVIGSLITVTYLAIDYTDWPAARRGIGVRDRWRAVRKDPGPFLGFGAAVWALLLVPGMNLFLMPAAVAGGTLLFLDLERVSEATKEHGVRPGLSG